MNKGVSAVDKVNSFQSKLSKTRTIALCQRGFTVLELLIVMFVIGILAGVVVPNVVPFLDTGNLSAARTEMLNVKTAALGYYGENHIWPNDSSTLTAFLTPGAKATYVFDNSTGFVTGVSDVTWSGITWATPPGPAQDGSWTK